MVVEEGGGDIRMGDSDPHTHKSQQNRIMRLAHICKIFFV